MYNGTGDVTTLVRIRTQLGTTTTETNVVAAEYTYSPYGEIVAVTGSDEIKDINPIRYKGYYYDTDTGWYNLKTRYYDPMVGRFINADGYISTGQGLTGNNMYAYCGNNPVMFSDSTGESPVLVVVGLLVLTATLTGCSSKSPSTPKPSKQSPSIPSGGKSVYKGSISICTDGSNGKKVPDSNWQPYTAFSKWTSAKITTLDAYTMPYVVMPTSKESRNGASLGDKALVINWDTGQSVWCIVGDSGPAWGEVSINVIWTIDNPNHMTANHASGLSNNYEIILYPGVSYGYDWSYGYREVKQ